MKMKFLAAVAAIFVGTQAGAAVINHVITFATNGAPNPVVIDLTLDTDLLQSGGGLTAGLTVNSVNFLHDGNIVYYNPFGLNTILIYDDTGGYTASTLYNDFFFQLANFDTLTATAFDLALAQTGPVTYSSSASSIVSKEVGVVPVPASLPLLAFGIGGLGLMARRKRKVN